jgi:hypothetical protein
MPDGAACPSVVIMDGQTFSGISRVGTLQQLGHKAFLRKDASHFGDMSSTRKTVGVGNPRESLDHQFKRLFAVARLRPFPLAQA